MLGHTLALLAVQAATVLANDAYDSGLLSGFQHGSMTQSSGGRAVCAAGDVYVNINATNQVFGNFTVPTNNIQATEDVLEIIETNSTFAARALTGPTQVVGRFQISARLCIPVGAAPTDLKTVQVFTPGLTLDQDYWDIPGYSYVDAAAAAGYATLTYDRLGIRNSQHPDPVRVVQNTAHVEIAHGLTQLLRTGQLGGRRWDQVVGVGHSQGSQISLGVTAKYPQDWRAVVLTGLSVNATYQPATLAALALQIARTTQGAQFAGLPDGYLTEGARGGTQLAFFRYPFFDPKRARSLACFPS